MSKVTAITDETGKIVAITHGHVSEATSRNSGSTGLRGGLSTLQGQTLRELDLEDDVSEIRTWSELHDKVRSAIQ